MTEVAADPLSELLVDATAIDRQAVAQALKGKIAIDAATGRLVLLPGFMTLDSRRKVLVLLLARKAARLLGTLDKESLSNKEVADTTGLPTGTAAPSLKSLRELRLIGQDDEKHYLVPNPQLVPAIQFLKGE